MPYGSNFPSLSFRTTGAWGAGNGLATSGRLTNTQADENIDELGRAIEDLRDNPPAAVGISNITSTASSFTIHLADATTYGPFALPVAQLSFQGEWTAVTAYQTNDIVKVTGDGVYLVLQDHTSAATFDSAAADSDGPIYHFMIGAGADGADGTNGTNGVDGADGATWLTGIGAPATSDGVPGDFYFDQGDSAGVGEGDIYQHQGSDAWVPIASTKGDTGATGAQGPTGAGANIIVEEGGVALGAVVSNLNFDGDDFNVVQESDGTANVTLAGGGKIAQVVNTQTGATSSGATTIAIDDTIPQNTEGNEFMTLAITPTNAASTLIIEVTTHLVSSSANVWHIAALFQDSVAGALATAYHVQSSAGAGTNITFCHKMTAGTASATTFKVRAGSNTGTIYFNGNSSGRLLGGVMASSITITEVLP